MRPDNPLIRTLRETRRSGRMALCGYFLVGYPTPEAFYRMVRAASEVDVFEFGIPANEPSMDGPVIVRAHEIVTQQRGIGAESALALLSGLRGTPQPRFVMTYSEVGRALEGFLRLCAANEVHGMIAPDIDAQEGAFVGMIARALNLAMITLLDARADDSAVQRATELGDIVYLKAATGRTGQRADLDGELHDVVASTIQRLRKIKPGLPIAVGIGLQTPAQVSALAKLDVDMAVIGTTLVEHVTAGEQSLVDYVHSLREATAYS